MNEFLTKTIIKAGEKLLLLKNDIKEGEPLDEIIQDFIIGEIQNHFLNPFIIAEEKEKSIYESIDNGWVIDPIDGTENFLNGLYEYSISIAYIRNGIVENGAVYAPEKKELYYAELNKGATLNNCPITVSNIKNLKDSDIYLSSFKTFNRSNEADAFNRIISKTGNFRINRSTALEMCYVGLGVSDARIMANSRIWDFAAASLIVSEAGGKVTCWDGSDKILLSNKIIASNKLIHDEIIKTLNYV